MYDCEIHNDALRDGERWYRVYTSVYVADWGRLGRLQLWKVGGSSTTRQLRNFMFFIGSNRFFDSNTFNLRYISLSEIVPSQSAPPSS